MGAGFASSGSGGQGFAIKLEGDGDTKLGNSSGDLHQITGTLAITGVISSSHGATLGNLILQDDARSLTLSGTISSSAGATFLGNLFTEDMNVSGSITIEGTAISSTPAELNLLDASTTSEASDGDWAVVERVAKATIDDSDWDVGLNSLGITIPDNGIVTKLVIDCTTTFVGGEPLSEITLALYDGSSELNVLVALQQIDFEGAQVTPYQVGLTAVSLTAFKLTAAGEIKLNVTEAALTAGEADVYIHYIIGA